MQDNTMSTLPKSATFKNKLTKISQFNIDDVVFGEPIVGETKISDKMDIKYRRVRYATKNPNGSYSDLIFIHKDLYSFGIQESTDPNTKQLTGYSIPLCLYRQTGATDDEQRFIEIVGEIVERTKNYLYENRKSIAQPDLEISDMRKMNPLYYKKDKDGVVDDSVCPKLYAKLIYSKKNSQILTKFYDKDRQKLEPEELMNKHFLVSPAIKFESVFIGSKISIQIKITEAIVETLDGQQKSLLFDDPECCDDLLNNNLLAQME